MKSKLVVFGTGDISELVTAFLKKESNYSIAGYCVEESFKKNTKNFLGAPVVRFEELSKRYPPSEFKLFIAIGNNYVRERIFTESKKKGYTMISHVTESVTLWDDLEYGENVLVSGISSLQPFVKVGDNTFIIGSKIGHHCIIGNHTLLSCSTLGGNVKVGDYSFLGLNSAVQHDTEIGRKNIIGIGCNINHDTGENEVYTANQSTVKRSISTDQIKSKYM